MKKSNKRCERTYETKFVKVEQPINLDVFCALVAKQMLLDEKFTNKESAKNGQIHGVA